MATLVYKFPIQINNLKKQRKLLMKANDMYINCVKRFIKFSQCSYITHFTIEIVLIIYKVKCWN